MKHFKIFAVAAMSLFAVSVSAQTKTDTIKVYGECGMCKNRIQKTLKIDGIAKADWNTETKLLVVTYDAVMISNDDIQKKIAAVGHDTEKYTALDSVYQKLPGCCHYERKKTENKDNSPVKQ
jgi:mercuric ion binding protein